LLIFEVSPDCLGLVKVGEQIDLGDAARFRPCQRTCVAAFDRGSHGHRNTRLVWRQMGVPSYERISGTPGNT
jgi:hypothetical protein